MRKLDKRNSPLGRRMRSGSGCPAVYIRSDSRSSVTSSGFRRPCRTSSASRRAAWTIAVIDGDIQNHPVFMGGGSLRLLDEPADVRRERLPVADKAGADVFVLKIPQGFLEVVTEQVHDGVHLFGRPPPVFGGEGVDRQIPDALLLAVFGDFPEHLGAGDVSGLAGQPPLLRPTTVPIHNNPHMSGNMHVLHGRNRFFSLKPAHPYPPAGRFSRRPIGNRGIAERRVLQYP